jgi:histidine transport system permease protein
MFLHESLYGYGPLIAQGALKTAQLALLSLGVALALGLISAYAKLSHNRLASTLATLYTTLIRGVPDLVLMLLLFYSMQIWLNELTDLLKLAPVVIDPFTAGVLTLGFIYGAYFTETFRGAYLAVPNGQLEAGAAYGMTRWQIFHRILFTQMMRFALPGIDNNWQVLLKATALVSLISLSDLVKATQDAGQSTHQMFFFLLVAALIYLIFAIFSDCILKWLKQRYSVGVPQAQQ